MYFSDSPAPLSLSFQALTMNCGGLGWSVRKFLDFFGGKTDMVKAFLYVRAQDGESTDRYFR